MLQFLKTLLILVFASDTTCSLSAGLENIGLGDIRTLVKLMCLSAAHSPPKTASKSPRFGGKKIQDGGHCQGQGQEEKEELVYLSTAIGALVQDNAQASQLLVHLCTQVSLIGYYGVKFLIIIKVIFKKGHLAPNKKKT